ncbi:hypothetical protein [Proteus myxofaciens]|uniref:Carrier domain-containing protein n=1 Tax=Proteus myxofaciens ATCC 19692 TaxID=1354337 RepID=A0A198FJ68_9GAMM|nr:hypothetical protein [Proteus myxofaciens]OAT24251.1 hypothetical protein M983_2651 [Proteus myxofaciens ATCC 19692]
MQPYEFINFINEKTGMNLNIEDINKDITEIDEWDSLTFIYMIIEFENKNNIKIDIEKILSCTNLNKILEVINHEVGENNE